jgi:hypothetical protein
MATITAYTDIISLTRAKNYLRVDDTLFEDDAEITSMIKAAFLFMERYTNHIFIARDFTQYVPPKIYNYPINSIDGVEEESWEHYYQRNMDMYCQEQIVSAPVLTTYNAGYEDTEDVPDDFIQAALQIIKVWYFEAEKQVNQSLIPISVKQVLDTYRRFV